MQKTEKHCKNQCFAITKRRKSVRKRVQKLKNPPPGQATCGTAKKDVANQKIEVKKLKNTVFFHFSLADFGRARSRTGVFRTVFYSVFWRRASRQKQEVLAEKCPPPGKPVTFYECHPAPSVRADLYSYLYLWLSFGRDCPLDLFSVDLYPSSMEYFFSESLARC